MTLHTLKATRDTVHLGLFSSQLKPVLVIQSGDWVEVETFTGAAVVDQAPPDFVTPELLDICHHLPADRRGPGPHLLTGPIFIEGAMPGDVLEVKLDQIWPRLPVGFNTIRPGKGSLPQLFPDMRVRFIDLDLEQQQAEFPKGSGITVPLHPFFGILGVATEATAQSTIPPGRFGGNLDNRHLGAGSRLFLPIFVPGALFSVGDGHSAQGDGEVNVTAIETSMNGRLQLTVRKDLNLTHPIGESTIDWISMGLGETLDEAFEKALTNMIDFIHRFVGIDREEAYVLCSLAVNFNITQTVNLPQKGVHGLLPKRILPQPIEI